MCLLLLIMLHTCSSYVSYGRTNNSGEREYCLDSGNNSSVVLLDDSNCNK